jgi:hypothetical protein
MLLVWGWKVIFKVVGTGTFSCPNCGGDRNFERRRAQRWFTFFWIPLIPLKVIGEVVRCTACKTDFRESVLARPTAGQFSDLLQNSVRGVMVNVLRRGVWNDQAARQIAIAEIAQAGAVGYSDAHLNADFQAVPEDLSPLLVPLAGQLPDTGKEAILLGATRVAAADGPIQPAERQLIDLVGAALGMTAAHVAGVVSSVSMGPGYGSAPAADAVPAQYQGQQGQPGQPQVPAQAQYEDPASMPTQALRVPPQGGAPVQDQQPWNSQQ